jgi:hypothetical protein
VAAVKEKIEMVRGEIADPLAEELLRFWSES